MWGLIPLSEICPIRLAICLRSFFGCVACEANQGGLCYGVKPVSRYVVCGDLSRCSHEGQGQLLSVDEPDLTDWSYRIIRGWSLPLLDLKVSERGHAVNQRQLPIVPGRLVAAH